MKKTKRQTPFSAKLKLKLKLKLKNQPPKKLVLHLRTNLLNTLPAVKRTFSWIFLLKRIIQFPVSLFVRYTDSSYLSSFGWNFSTIPINPYFLLRKTDVTLP